MSAAVNDRPRDVLVPLPHLPLTGELHPLRREFARWLATGNVITITLAVVVCATIYFWPRPAPVDGGVLPRILDHVIIQSPPPIDPGSGGVTEANVITPDVGKVNYEATKDTEVVTSPGVEPGGGTGTGEPGPPEPMGSVFTGGGDIVIDPPTTPSPSEISVFDTMPVLLSIDPPVYPQMVRDAGIDGTVMVRVFIALNGHVKDATVVEGSSALREAALACARTAIFKPALQGSHPVEVWVVIPITFELHQR